MVLGQVSHSDKDCTLICVMLSPVARATCNKLAELAKPDPLPASRQIKSCFIFIDWWQRFLLFECPTLQKLRFLLRNSAQQLCRRFVIRVLLHQLPPHGEVQDGLAEGFDLVGAGGQGGEGLQGKAGMELEG